MLSTSKLSADAAWDALDPAARIHIVKGKVEDVTIPEHVDVIVSEPLGAPAASFFLFPFAKPGDELFCNPTPTRRQNGAHT